MLGLARAAATGAPVERKVQASTAAAFISGLVLWALGRYVFRGAVPDVLVSWVYAVVPAALTFFAGYKAKHTSRPDLEPAAPPVPGPQGLPDAGKPGVPAG